MSPPLLLEGGVAARKRAAGAFILVASRARGEGVRAAAGARGATWAVNAWVARLFCKAPTELLFCSGRDFAADGSELWRCL